jgi:alpha-D-xyloside xylohydrolase
MRALAMDFRTDVRAQNIGDEYMFGPAILVAPVTEPGATVRHLYLPKAKWYDFWTGKAVDGGAAIDTAAPIERMPLFVRAGSILPMGPDVQWASEKPADPIELRVYAGADGHFTLYEDQGDTYNYEKGAFATIAFAWDDASHTLTIGERKGSFTGMLGKRTFHIVFVGAGHGAGIDPSATADKTVEYTGAQVSVVR